MKRNGLSSVFVLTVAVLQCAHAFAQKEIPVDPGLHIYQRVEGVKGTLRLCGSDTISQLAGNWASDFRKMYPEVEIKIDVQGARNAIPSVINQQADIGLLSREIRAAEVEQFKAKFGHAPVVLTPALESIAIFVHKDNPVESLTLAQLDAIYSTSLKRGAPKQALTWGDVGVGGKWATMPIVCQARDAETGSQVFFQRGVLGGGEFRQGMVGHASSVEMIKTIAGNQGAVGFAGSGYETPDVKAVPLAWKAGEPASKIETVGYPLLRPLQLIVNKAPNQELSLLEHEFIKYMFSRAGQQQVIVGGFVPMPARPAQVSLDLIGAKVLH